MSRSPPDLFAKLDLTLKRANMSKGRLALEARVDKSLVGRWARGLVVPSEHNLSLVTGILAQRFAGFTLASWDLPMEAFAASIGAASPARQTLPAPDAALPGRNPAEPARGSFLARSFAESLATMGRDRLNCVGVYLGFRHGLAMGGRLICDLYAIWREGDALHFRQFGISFGHAGPVTVLRSQVYLMGENMDVNNSIFFAILVGIHGGRAVRMDGLILTVAGHHRLNSPSATTIVMQRIADMPESGGGPDIALFGRVVERIKAVVAEDRLKPLIAPEILAAISAPASLNHPEKPSEHSLLVATERSLSRHDVECDEATARSMKALRETFLAEDAALLPMAPLAGAPGVIF